MLDSTHQQLAGEIGKVLKEEGRRIGVDLRAKETGALSIGKRLVRPDLKAGEHCGRPGCVLDICNFYRTNLHDDDVETKKETDAFFKHFEIFHLGVQGGIANFDIQVQSIHKKSEN